MGKFVNPYNFVPLAINSPLRNAEDDGSEKELFTGKIRYKIKTLSPLFIPNTSNDRILGVGGVDDKEDAYHKSYDFFSYNDLSGEKDSKKRYEPVIPGSEIRGMVRSVYEAMTNSCLSAVDENVVLSKRTAEHFEPGVLLKKGDGYELYEAKDYIYRGNGRKDYAQRSYVEKGLPPDGKRVFFTVDKKSAPNRPPYAKMLACNISLTQKPGQLHEGYLVKGEPGPELAKSNGSKCDACPLVTKKECKKNNERRCYLLEKHCAHIFEKNQKIVKVMKKEEAANVIQRMDMLLDIYGDNREHGGMYSEYKKAWENFKDGREKGIAVYYSTAEDICYLSPACITREVYKNTLGKILGEHRACSCKDNMCPACRLFGAVNGGLQAASKIRFADARVLEKKEDDRDYYDKPITLLELSSPKLSSTEFYLQHPNVAKKILNWTYDYYVMLNGDRSTSVNMYTPQISGRKFYWHSPKTVDWLRSVQDKIEKNERNKTVRPLKKGVAFIGELYFERITKAQLDELILILNISALDEHGRYALKLGSAKPLGFGSVKMQVEQVSIRTVSLNENGRLVYNADNSYDYQKVEISEGVRGTGILTILDTKALDKESAAGAIVHYPYVNKIEPGEEEGFNWFVENRTACKEDRKDKKLDLSRKEKAPGTRTQVIYKEYMLPLAPTLIKNPVLEGKDSPTNAAGTRTVKQGYRGNSQQRFRKN